MPPSDELEAAVRAVQRAGPRGVVVVAPTGNRPTEADPLFDRFGTYRPGEDAAAAVFPAGYDDVVGANAPADGEPEATDDTNVTDVVLQSSATDVAAPTYGGISVGLNGSTCVLSTVDTALATAEVAGVVAMLRARFPEDDASRIVRRLLGTASGRMDERTPLLGAGVVQPVEALTRPLPQPGEAARVSAGAPSGRAEAPARLEDGRALARRQALWWGLLGGGALVLALVLRPVLGRRQ
ncbi:MAG: S8/S53 family peptidase [Nocardioides sp.]